MATFAEGVGRAVNGIAVVAKENSAATEGVSESAARMTSQVEEMTAQAEQMEETAAQLRELVARFQVDAISGNPARRGVSSVRRAA